MKTSQAYYHKGQFLFSEKGWPVKPFYTDYAPKLSEWNIALNEYDQALSLALEESVPFEDQDAIKKMIWLNESGFYSCCNSRRACLSDFNACIGTVKEGLYTFPEVEGEVVEVPEFPGMDHTSYPTFINVFRIKPSLPSPMKTGDNINLAESR